MLANPSASVHVAFQKKFTTAVSAALQTAIAKYLEKNQINRMLNLYKPRDGEEGDFDWVETDRAKAYRDTEMYGTELQHMAPWQWFFLELFF